LFQPFVPPFDCTWFGIVVKFFFSLFFYRRLFPQQVKEQEREIRILILGLDNAGKTTICKKLCGQSIDQIEPTLGFHIHTLEHLTYKLNLWDIGGQRTIRAYWRNYFEQTDGLIWVVDSCDGARLEVCKQEMQQVLQQERLAGATLLVLANKQDLLVGLHCQSTSSSVSHPPINHDNNSDHDATRWGGGVELNNKDAVTLLECASTTAAATATTTTTTTTAALSCEEISQALELNDQNIRHDQRHWSIQACSAVTGQGLVEGIDWLVEDISNRIFLLS
jgi:small GTP-binding protein